MRPQPTPAAAPVTQVRTRSRRRGRRSLVLPVVGALFVGAGVLGLMDASDSYDVAIAAGLATVGGAIALGAVVGRRVGRLLPFGAVLLAAGAVAAASPVGLSAGIGGKAERPVDTAQLERSYEFGIGDFTVDLTDLALPSGTTRVDVELGIGDLLVRVPEHTALEIDARAGAGQVTVLGESDDGTGAEERAVLQGSTPAAPVLELDADVGFGHVAVRRG